MMIKKNISVDLQTKAGSVAYDGAAVYTAIMEGKDICAEIEGDIVFIPFHSVQSAVISVESETVEDPEDTTCPSEGGGGKEVLYDGSPEFFSESTFYYAYIPNFHLQIGKTYDVTIDDLTMSVTAFAVSWGTCIGDDPSSYPFLRFSLSPENNDEDPELFFSVEKSKFPNAPGHITITTSDAMWGGTVKLNHNVPDGLWETTDCYPFKLRGGKQYSIEMGEFSGDYTSAGDSENGFYIGDDEDSPTKTYEFTISSVGDCGSMKIYRNDIGNVDGDVYMSITEG